MACGRVEYTSARSANRVSIYMRIPELLESTRFWFVVGLGNNPVPAAFGVTKFLKDHGKHIAPIYPRAEIVHCEQGFASISEAAQL